MSDILIVDDERDIRELISEILIDEGYATRLVGTSEEAMHEITSQPPGLLILDIWLKDSEMDGIDILKKVKFEYPEVPVVIISGHGNIEIAVAAIKQGAYDFIEKPFNIDQLLVVIRRAMETSRLRRENITLRQKDAPVSDLIGSSAGFRAMVSQLDKVAKSNSRIMLRGGSGVGKETAARYMHAQSDRAAGPFVVVGCATIEPDRMEEALFGRESGDQNGAQGLLEQAHGGIIYFDEVADMPMATQSKILRVLVDQKFQRVGGSDLIKVDLRVLSSTSCDLEQEIAERRFREELFHRLNVVPVEVPTLEERRRAATTTTATATTTTTTTTARTCKPSSAVRFSRKLGCRRTAARAIDVGLSGPFATTWGGEKRSRRVCGSARRAPRPRCTSTRASPCSRRRTARSACCCTHPRRWRAPRCTPTGTR